jgi:hypothetical protein
MMFAHRTATGQDPNPDNDPKLNDPKFVNQVYKRSREMRQQLIASGYEFSDADQPLFGGEDFAARAEATNQRIAMHNKRKQSKKASAEQAKKTNEKPKAKSEKNEEEECPAGKSSSQNESKKGSKNDAKKKTLSTDDMEYVGSGHGKDLSWNVHRMVLDEDDERFNAENIINTVYAIHEEHKHQNKRKRAEFQAELEDSEL